MTGNYCTTWTDNCRDYLISGLSGVGKTYFIENNVIPEIVGRVSNVERFVITESSTHEDFFGAYMPQMDGDKVDYRFMPGPAARIISAAYNQPTEKFVLVVENINFGNAYEVLGDIFQLLDRVEGKEKCESKYKISISDDVRSWFCKKESEIDKLYLPDNLYIICTMTISTNVVYRLDTAFRRRFKMVYIAEDGTVYGNIPNNVNTALPGVNYDNEDLYISFDKWNDDYRKKFNEKITDEDKKLTEHFMKMVEGKIALTDFIMAIYMHVSENVYRNVKSQNNRITAKESVEEALSFSRKLIDDKEKNGEKAENIVCEIVKELFYLNWEKDTSNDNGILI